MDLLSKSRRLVGLGLMVALAAPRANAHLVSTGLGPLYDGIGHFCLSPEDVLPVIALALLAGMRGPAPGRWALFLLPLAWLGGGLGGLLASAPTLAGQIPAALSFLFLGILVALDRPFSLFIIGGLAILVGALHGFYNGLAMREAGSSSALLQLAGVMVTLFVLTAIIAGLVLSFRRPWMRIVMRVAGSWIGASGLLLLGWSLRTLR